MPNAAFTHRAWRCAAPWTRRWITPPTSNATASSPLSLPSAAPPRRYVVATPHLDCRQEETLSVRGSLLLLLAIVAARRGDQNAAQDVLREASQLAEQLGCDGNWLWTAFGPTNVAEQSVSRNASARTLHQAGWRIWVIPTPHAASWIDCQVLAQQTGYPIRHDHRLPGDRTHCPELTPSPWCPPPSIPSTNGQPVSVTRSRWAYSMKQSGSNCLSLSYPMPSRVWQRILNLTGT
jgi:hypothetical protein